MMKANDATQSDASSLYDDNLTENDVNSTKQF